MAYFSSRQRRWIGQRRSSVPREDPYAPGSAAYAERHRVRESEFAGLPGLVRVDVGGPEKQAQPSPISPPSVREEAPTVTPKVTPAVTGRANPKEPRAITRDA